MALIGNKNTFGLEYHILESDKYNLIGSAFYWINNYRIGNDLKVGLLNDLISCFVDILRDSGKRFHEEFFKINSDDFFETVDKTLFDYNDIQYVNRANEEQWARFNIRPEVVMFDGWKVYQVDFDETSRILVKNKEYETLQDFFLQKGIVDRILYESYTELLSIEETAINRFE
jgi:hypothetical protein